MVGVLIGDAGGGVAWSMKVVFLMKVENILVVRSRISSNLIYLQVFGLCRDFIFGLFPTLSTVSGMR